MNNMKDQRPPTQHNQKQGQNVFSRLYTSTILYAALLALSFILLLALSYTLGYSRGSSLRNSISTFTISKTILPYHPQSSELLHSHAAPVCAKPTPPQLVRQTIIDRVYNGTSPYENFNPASLTLPLLPMSIQGWGSYGATYKSLIQKVQPKTIIKYSTFLGASATYMADFTSQLGLKTQILCLDDFNVWPGSRDLFVDIAMSTGDNMLLNHFMQNVIFQNATENILPVPISSKSAFEKLCEWGIFGDLIEVDAGRDFRSAWSDINSAYKLLRPGGVLFGHNNFTSYYSRGVRQAVRLFARVNKFQVITDGQHWMINSA